MACLFPFGRKPGSQSRQLSDKRLDLAEGLRNAALEAKCRVTKLLRAAGVPPRLGGDGVDLFAEHSQAVQGGREVVFRKQ